MGLEQMVSDDLVAMIPVDHEMAVKKKWGRMPLPELVGRLATKTKGRLLRVDDQATSTEALVSMKPDSTDQETWTTFTNRVRVAELFYEISFP